jgi:hypothetical protein
MNQISKLLIQSCFFLLLTAIGTAGIVSAAELSPRQKQLNNQSVSCKANQDLSCAKICTVAAQNPGNAALGERCDKAYRAALDANSKPKAQPQQRDPKHVLRDQARFCAIHKDNSCAQACATATKNAEDATAVQQCNVEYQRVLAANPPPPQRPEESMTMAQRIALMADKAAYCKAKKAMNTKIEMRRPLDGCIGICSSNRVSDPNYPQSQRESIVVTCENLYYPIFQKLGK